MNLEMIESMWKEDSKLDDEKLDHDSLRVLRKKLVDKNPSEKQLQMLDY